MADWQDPITIATWIVIALAAMTLMVMSIIWLTRLYLQRLLKEREAMADAVLHHQKALLETSVTIQERERNRIAAELHDDLLSKLSILALASHSNDTLDVHRELIGQSIRTARSISHDLCPPLIEATMLDQLLADHVKPLESSFDIKFWVREYEPLNIAANVKLHVLRVFQEVVNNIIKHANAQSIAVDLRITSQYLVLLVADDGIGFVHTPSKGLGLRNIELRAQLLNGQFRFRSRQSSGMQFTLLIPL